MNSNLSKTLQRFVFGIVLTASFFIIITYLLSMGLGILVFFSTTEGLTFSRDSILLHPLLIIDTEITVNAGLYFLFLWWVFALCFATAWKYQESLSCKIREFASGTAKRSPFTNNLLAMPAITSMLLVIIIALDFFQSQGGVPTGSLPQGEPFLDFLRVSQAPLVEEAIFRIVPIGIFLVTYIFLIGQRTKPFFSLGRRLKTCILSVLQPDRAKEKVGLKTISEGGLLGGMVWAEWIMGFFTASLFGVAHYFGGWGPGKISQAAISGLVFALAYLYYGVQAPILLHWYFNYYFSVFQLSLDYYSAEVDFLSFSWSANIFLGILMWIVVFIFGVVTLFKALRRRPEITPVPEPPFGSV